ncbi:MAG TPA: LytR C-terminal domain-containing protein [Burkholderiaceae bacterium]|nr:LytR C-terminal domain-containing protein [Burkholderiaceae bacterium]
MRLRQVPQRLASTPSRSVGLVMALVMAGCATPTPEAWRVVPRYRVTHAGTGAAQGYFALARKYEGEGRVGLALVAWRKAALEAPDDVEILDALGIAEARQGFHDRAIATLRRASALAPPQAARLNNLGYALLLDGRNDEARRVLLEALALEPQHAQARTNLSRLEPIGAVAAVAFAVPVPNSFSVADLQTAASQQPADGIRLIAQPTTGPLPLSSTPGTSATVPAIATEVRSALSEEAHPVNLHAVRIQIANGNGIPGMAARLASWLRRSGLENAMHLSNLPPYDSPSTVVHYRPGFAEQAREIARRMQPGAMVAQQPGDARGADVRVVIGRDARPLAAGTQRRGNGQAFPGWSSRASHRDGIRAGQLIEHPTS